MTSQRVSSISRVRRWRRICPSIKPSAFAAPISWVFHLYFLSINILFLHVHFTFSAFSIYEVYNILWIAALCQETIGDQSLVPRYLLREIEAKYEGQPAPLIDEDLHVLRTSYSLFKPYAALALVSQILHHFPSSPH